MFHRFKCSLPLVSPCVDWQVAHACWHSQSLLERQDPEMDKNRLWSQAEFESQFCLFQLDDPGHVINLLGLSVRPM